MAFDLRIGNAQRIATSRLGFQHTHARARDVFYLENAWRELGDPDRGADGIRADATSHVTARVGRRFLHVLGNACSLVILGKFAGAAQLALARRLRPLARAARARQRKLILCLDRANRLAHYESLAAIRNRNARAGHRDLSRSVAWHCRSDFSRRWN